MRKRDSGKASRVILIFSLTALMAVLLLGCGCMEAGELQVESRTVGLDGAEAADVELEMVNGDMKISGGSDELLDAEFRYNVAEWKPEIEYGVRDRQGELSVRQPEAREGGSGARNEWDLLLNEELPMVLKAELENGNSVLSLNSSSLETLELSVRNGNMEAEIAGNQPLLEELELTNSNGNVVLGLPGNYPSLTSLTIESVNGNIDAKLAGSYASLNNMEMKLNSGSIIADLSGDWSSNAGIEVSVNTGDITLTLPRDIGVYVDAVTPARVEADGFSREGSDYVNDAYGESDVTLKIKASSNAGAIKLLLAD
ncbi:MAG: toast rack family protein [Methanosarcinaceae archaeon]|uniref:toast rack family protein n=1 Tax=Methanosarcina sp. MTP4 TaxID=1434100 RepID=UPI00064FD9E3|nr:toast rack family protein [Methanosarcina sp. MTP4]